MKKKQNNQENSERWLLTYSDLITLLMVLFVILYASSNVDKNKYKQISNSFHQAFSIGDKDGVIQENDSEEQINQQDPTIIEEDKLDAAKEKVDDLIKESGLNGSISTSVEERGLVITFTDNIFFTSGNAIIKDDYKKKLVSISKVLNDIDNYIRVEGHTDNMAISNQNFHSNWQLSSVRAANVVELLINEGKIDPNRLSSVGYGEFRPIKSNDTEAGKAENRRVDIVILNSKFNKSETNQ